MAVFNPRKAATLKTIKFCYLRKYLRNLGIWGSRDVPILGYFPKQGKCPGDHVDCLCVLKKLFKSVLG